MVSIFAFTNRFYSFYSIFLKQMAVTDLSRELKELSCIHEKVLVSFVFVLSMVYLSDR